MKKTILVLGGVVGISVLFVGCITAQTATPRTLGPFDCTGCSLNISDPSSATSGTYATTNTQLSFYLINSRMVAHDHVILCDKVVCADYELTDSNKFIQKSREQRVKGPDDSGDGTPATPPSPPSSGGGAGPGSPGSTLSYWPSSTHVCAKTTTHWPDGSTTVEVDCKAV